LICLEYRIPYRIGETIRIKFSTDAHLMNRYCDERALRAFFDDNRRNIYFVDVGDWFDAIAPSDPRYRRSVVRIGSSDAVMNDGLDISKEILYSHRKRMIGMGRGNHDDLILRRGGMDLTRLLLGQLEGETKDNPTAFPRSLGYSWGLTLRFRAEDGGGRTLRIRGHHGWGRGSRTQEADLTKFSKDMAVWDADVFIYGHVHRRQTDSINRMAFTGSRIISRPKLLGICGTFLKTYSTTDEPTYSERAGYPPTEIGGLTLCVKPQDSRSRQPLKYWFSDEED